MMMKMTTMKVVIINTMKTMMMAKILMMDMKEWTMPQTNRLLLQEEQWRKLSLPFPSAFCQLFIIFLLERHEARSYIGKVLFITKGKL
jgi:hypothetical protein